MKVTHITDYIIPMSSKTKTTARDIKGTYRNDYTDGQGVRILHSYIPANRPAYGEWVKELGINEMTHLYHPDAKAVADRINAPVGVPRRPTLMDEILGRDVWDAERYE